MSIGVTLLDLAYSLRFDFNLKSAVYNQSLEIARTMSVSCLHSKTKKSQPTIIFLYIATIAILP